MNLVATRIATQSWLDNSANQHYHIYGLSPPPPYHHQLHYQCITRSPIILSEINWRPPQTHLHYHALYCGIYEFLREPPSRSFRNAAVEYLMKLQRSRTEYQLIPSERRLQEHRIAWVLEWLKAMPDDEGDDSASDADTAECVW
jgi:hypothetical protein